MSRPPGRRNVDREMLVACGTRPVRKLALLMAQIGPVPTVAEMRAMVRAQCTTKARQVQAERRAERKAAQQAAITKLRRRGATCCGYGGEE